MTNTTKGFVAAAIIAAVCIAGDVRARAQSAADADVQLLAMMTTINNGLATAGLDVRVDYAEYMTAGDEAGHTVFFSNRGNKQLGAHFVAGDPRRHAGNDITYIVDQTEGAVDGLTIGQTTAAIDRAMATWDNVNCSAIPITKLPDVPGVDLGVVQFLNDLGGAPFWLADITHAGWFPAGILAPNVIAVTFTFVWVDGPNPTDIDNDGRLDVAFREIYYNDLFTWQINANIDVETVALHESGHGLSQGHFGAASLSGNGKLHFSPRAVMNAAYSGLQQGIKGTDNGGHCSIWASWPN